MSAWLQVLEPGVAVTVQDRGRVGHRHIGVPVSGALDVRLLAAANALLGNDPDAAVLEVCLSGPAMQVLSGPVRVALAGDISAQVTGTRGPALHVPPWHTATLFPGDVIRVSGVAGGGVGCVGVSGGVQVPLQLGSRSTYLRARIGGVQGRALAVGDRLPCAPFTGNPWRESAATRPWLSDAGPVRVLFGPQGDHFTPEALHTFLASDYRVTRDIDRMGLRLDGPALAHSALGADIVSDGVVPGAIQVPANGQPIVLMADCQTSGGYPKIATVIRADLPRLAHLRPGDGLRFVAVDHAQARAALSQQAQQLAQWCAGIAPFRPPGWADEAALYQRNLISGCIRGDE